MLLVEEAEPRTRALSSASRPGAGPHRTAWHEMAWACGHAEHVALWNSITC